MLFVDVHRDALFKALDSGAILRARDSPLRVGQWWRDTVPELVCHSGQSVPPLTWRLALCDTGAAAGHVRLAAGLVGRARLHTGVWSTEVVADQLTQALVARSDLSSA